MSKPTRRKRIIFPATSRVHGARQKALLEELRREFDVDVFEPKTSRDDLEAYTILAAIEFRNYVSGKDYDFALIRADRMELLPIAAICAYRGIPIAHIEGGADSGPDVIDTRIRNSITALADVHFVTDDGARRRVQGFGADNVFDVGSLDVSFAAKVLAEGPPRPVDGDYVLLLHHSLPGEPTETVVRAVGGLGLKVAGVKSNADYGKSLMTEEYSPEDFIGLLYHAKCFVSNSSAACKESSVLGTPTVLVGSRQDGRLTGRNAIRVRHDEDEIRLAAAWQCAHPRYARDDVYYKAGTERKMAELLRKL